MSRDHKRETGPCAVRIHRAPSSRSLVEGGGFNQPWSWHLDPSTVHAVEVSVELCDGRPSMVEESLDYWLDAVGAFCPWGARVVDRVR